MRRGSQVVGWVGLELRCCWLEKNGRDLDLADTVYSVDRRGKKKLPPCLLGKLVCRTSSRFPRGTGRRVYPDDGTGRYTLYLPTTLDFQQSYGLARHLDFPSWLTDTGQARRRRGDHDPFAFQERQGQGTRSAFPCSCANERGQSL